MVFGGLGRWGWWEDKVVVDVEGKVYKAYASRQRQEADTWHRDDTVY